MHLVCQGLPACERAHVLIGLLLRLGLLLVGQQRCPGRPLRKRRAAVLRWLCSAGRVLISISHLPLTHRPRHQHERHS